MVADITEYDIETLELTRCCRKELRRTIAKSRDTGMIATSSTNGMDTAGYDRWSSASDEKSPSANGTGGGPAKRKYRHRPKHDPNAPERPYSAYVMFSNHMRDELKDQALTFTAISRTVGTRWQALGRHEKEAWQSRASAQMAKYKVKLTDYHQTESYHRHKTYVGTFKSAQEAKENERKHARTSSITKPVSRTLRLQGSESSLRSPKVSGFDHFPPSSPVEAYNSGNSMQSKTNSSDLSTGIMRPNVSSESSLGVDREVQQRSVNLSNGTISESMLIWRIRKGKIARRLKSMRSCSLNCGLTPSPAIEPQYNRA